MSVQINATSARAGVPSEATRNAKPCCPGKPYDSDASEKRPHHSAGRSPRVEDVEVGAGNDDRPVREVRRGPLRELLSASASTATSNIGRDQDQASPRFMRIGERSVT